MLSWGSILYGAAMSAALARRRLAAVIAAGVAATLVAPRTMEHLDGAMRALDIKLDDKKLSRLSHARAATERARPRRPLSSSAPTPPRPRRLGGLVDDLVDPLVAQVQHLGDLPQRPTRMQPADCMVIVHPRPRGSASTPTTAW